MNESEEEIEAVWKKGQTDANNDSNIYRKDACDAWISRKQHGNRDSPYGWEIDHIKPLKDGGSDDLSNKRPLHWKNNASKQAGKLDCPVTSQGDHNIGL